MHRIMVRSFLEVCVVGVQKDEADWVGWAAAKGAVRSMCVPTRIQIDCFKT